MQPVSRPSHDRWALIAAGAAITLPCGAYATKDVPSNHRPRRAGWSGTLADRQAGFAITPPGYADRLGIQMFARSVAQYDSRRQRHHGGCEV